jgi:hypothetical protein
MSKQVEVLGLPPREMIQCSKKALKYFVEDTSPADGTLR